MALCAHCSQPGTSMQASSVVLGPRPRHICLVCHRDCPTRKAIQIGQIRCLTFSFHHQGCCGTPGMPSMIILLRVHRWQPIRNQRASWCFVLNVYTKINHLYNYPRGYQKLNFNTKKDLPSHVCISTDSRNSAHVFNVNALCSRPLLCGTSCTRAQIDQPCLEP